MYFTPFMWFLVCFRVHNGKIRSSLSAKREMDKLELSTLARQERSIDPLCARKSSLTRASHFAPRRLFISWLKHNRVCKVLCRNSWITYPCRTRSVSQIHAQESP